LVKVFVEYLFLFLNAIVLFIKKNVLKQHIELENANRLALPGN
jgi:HAMP domain-containing protein